MRIVGGRHRGRALATPKGDAIRPTSDRVREAIFNILGHGDFPPLEGARVLDLFSGTGALGLEALSRGARFALFVEESAEGRGLVRTNVETMQLGGCTKIFRRDATRLGAIGSMEPFDLVFADPPYGRRLGEGALAAALAGGWLAADAACILEEAADAPFETPAGFALADERQAGETLVRFLRLDAAGG